MNDDLQTNRADAIHARCWNLLPWWVNGTLSADEASSVEQHVSECAECTAELVLQRNLQAHIRTEAVLMAPQGAWQKMAERLDSEDEAVARGHFKLPQKAGLWPWAVAAQATLIVGMAAILWQQSRTSGDAAKQDIAMLQPRYETLTAASAAVPRDAVRVVFRHTMTVAEVNALLRESLAQIVAGPTEAGVYMVTKSPPDNADLLKSLRIDKRVIFAEPSEYKLPAAK